MKRRVTVGILALFVTLPVAPALADDDEDAIRAASIQFQESFAAADAASVASYYTIDAALLPAGGPRVEGRQAIQDYWQAAMDAGIADLQLNTLEIEDDDDLAYETGSYSLSTPMEDGTLGTVTGHYLVVWEEGDDDLWRMHRDIWNIDAAQ